MKYYLVTVLISSMLSLCALAGIDQAPQNFASNGKKSVWVDFISADYSVNYLVKQKKVTAVSIITFEQRVGGYPLFDLVPAIGKLSLNSLPAVSELISTPNNETQVRRVDTYLDAGIHELVIYSEITNGLSFSNQEIRSNFWVKDMLNRHMLERYLPTNLEFDQYIMSLNVSISETQKSHIIYTNGILTEHNKNNFSISYPNYFNSSSIYFHLTPANSFAEKKFFYSSINEKKIQITVYSDSSLLANLISRRVEKYLDELEEDYGAWPHSKLIVYADGNFKGGMEYPGAVKTGWFALGHELQHNYFARAVMPANGEAGWIDEAVASWRDYFHYKIKDVGFHNLNIANHSEYVRKTDKRSYAKGRRFLAFIANKYETESLSLKGFFRFYFEKRVYTTITNQDFLEDLELYFGVELEHEFEKYIY
jgi:hypothetical protein